MTRSPTDTEREVVAALDESTSEFVIADIGRDDAWLSVREGDARILRDWC
ncbi:MAG: hypothetical protein ABEH80_00045 [Halobaculum sp.]|jgi:hypothetical protein